MSPVSESWREELSPIAVEDSIEALFATHDTTSRSIYLTTIIIVVATLGGAAITSIDLTVRAPATLAPSVERQTLRSLSEGAVERVFVSAGQPVKVGDTLIALATSAAEQASDAASGALAFQERRRADLNHLLTARFTQVSPRAFLLAQSTAVARATSVEWRQGSIQVARTERARDRTVQLMKRGFAVPAEVEAVEFDLARAREERSLALERRRSAWAEEIADADQRIMDLKRDISALNTARASRYVRAPVAGTIEEIAPLTRGSVLRSGDPVATISPEGLLVANALVAPRDVAHLRVGMPAHLLIEGYDVQEWGAVNAVVTAVARDYTISQGRPVFRVQMRLRHEELHRANGTTARLGKGLGCQVRFLLGTKRILDLVRQRSSEWLDPVTPNVD